MPVEKTRDTEAQRVREKPRGTERYGVGQEAAGTQPQTCPAGRAGEKPRETERYGVVNKQDRPMRFRAHSLTHGMRAIFTEGLAMKGIRRKTGARHECKISYSWPRLGATAALFAAVPGARAFGQRPAGTVMGSMRFRAHSLTHGMRAVLMEGIAVNGIRRKTGARHECKISYSWPGLGATAALFAAVPGAQAREHRPPGTARGAMRFGAHSLTHGARAILMEGIGMQGIRPKTGARHECKTAYSSRAAERCRASMPDLRSQGARNSLGRPARLRTTQPWHQS